MVRHEYVRFLSAPAVNTSDWPLLRKKYSDLLQCSFARRPGSAVSDGNGQGAGKAILCSPSTPRQKRIRKSKFDIFVDVNTKSTSATSSLKKLKADERVSLSINTVPIASLQDLDAPFPFSPLSPLWKNIENYAEVERQPIV
ncbi:hypothetical protein B5807_10341 [Epicoccum nigrum]|uniref:Uncharacterized protein n=1 Tax=Epicoccum nigrum TaxID=105696 RepID=A0A1Y2LRA3_EPING|nr:hypothetical protein B5807_10341 [Epicoccum nigrum]